MTATDELRRLLDERGATVDESIYPDRRFAFRVVGSDAEILLDNSYGRTGRYAVFNLTPAQAVEATLGSDLEAENAKLRELVRHMRTCLEHYEPGDTISCEQCPYDNETWGCDYERLMAELGVDFDG